MGSYISVFSLCRAIRLAKRIDRSILKSIVTPSTGLPRQSQFKNEIANVSEIIASPQPRFPYQILKVHLGKFSDFRWEIQV